MRLHGRSVVFLGRLVLKFRRHSPQPACDREIEGGSRHRNQYLGLPTQICTTDHSHQPFERGLSWKTTQRPIRSNIGNGLDANGLDRKGLGGRARADVPARDGRPRGLYLALLALLLDLVERLGEALERILVGRLGAAARGSL